MSIAAIIKPANDAEMLEDEMKKAFRRLDKHIQTVPCTADDVVIDHAEKDAARILEGTSTYTATAPMRNILESGNANPGSAYYQRGKKYYSLYCETVEKTVKASNPNRKLSFPIWRD